MKHQIWSLLVVMAFLHMTAESQLTVPIGIPQHRANMRHRAYKQAHHQNQQHHQLQVHSQSSDIHDNGQCYPLEPKDMYFTLGLIVAELPYNLHIDTGSSDLWIKGDNSSGAPSNKYTCSDCQNSRPQIQMDYLDGPLFTYQKKVIVQLGNHTFNQSILIAYQVTDNFVDSEGILGLSFPSLAKNPHPTFIQTLINNKIIDKYAFGVNLNFQENTKSFITFGSYDSTSFEGNLSLVHLISPLYYIIHAQGVSIGDDKLLHIEKAILDTGNTCISIPIQHQQSILKSFNKCAQNKCFFQRETSAPQFSLLRCKVGNFSQLPTITIAVNDQTKLPIEKQAYLQACSRKPEEENSFNSIDEGFWYCDSYIEVVRNQQQLFLGDGFFARYYTYFDLQDKKVGFAKNNGNLTLDYIAHNPIDYNATEWSSVDN